MSKAWPMVPLGEVLTERQEVPSDDGLASGEIPIVAKVGFDDGQIQLRADAKTKTGMILIRPGDLVVSGINAAKGAIAIYKEDNTRPIAGTIHYGAYIPNKERVEVSFLWWLLRSRVFRDLLLEYVPGGIKTELKAKRLLPILVPLPPLSEQRRIVARIEALAGKINEARGLKEQAAEEAEALWALGATEAFDGLVERYPIRPLSELVAIRGGGTPSKSDPFYWEGSIPWITPKDMKARELWDSIDHISERATEETAAKLIAPGAVLVVVRGMILAHTFPSAVLRVNAAINQDMKALVLSEEELIPEFLCAVFWAYSTRVLELVEKSTHDTRKLETEKLLDAKVPVPTLAEQHRVVAELDALQSQVGTLERLQAETAAELDALLPSILDKAFCGEL